MLAAAEVDDGTARFLISLPPAGWALLAALVLVRQLQARLEHCSLPFCIVITICGLFASLNVAHQKLSDQACVEI